MCFDLEKMLFLNHNQHISNKHVFVSGMARSGTTILLNAIYKTNEFGSLTYDDMPFILSTNLWKKFKVDTLNVGNNERAHGDGIKINIKSPEAFEEVFWKTFNKGEVNLSIEFNNFINLILKNKNQIRYLSKNNQNINRIDLIKTNFPKSSILIPFRDPLQHAYSLLTQHKKFTKLQKNDNFVFKRPLEGLSPPSIRILRLQER